jgi:hypothetical protein
MLVRFVPDEGTVLGKRGAGLLTAGLRLSGSANSGG